MFIKFPQFQEPQVFAQQSQIQFPPQTNEIFFSPGLESTTVTPSLPNITFDVQSSYQSACKLIPIFDQIDQLIIHLIHQTTTEPGTGPFFRGEKKDFLNFLGSRGLTVDGKEINSKLYTFMSMGFLEKIEPDGVKLNKFKKISKAPSFTIKIHPVQNMNGSITGYSAFQLVEYVYFTIFSQNPNSWLTADVIAETISPEGGAAKNTSKLLYPLLLFLAKKDQIVSDPPIQTNSNLARNFMLVNSSVNATSSDTAAAAAAPTEEISQGLTNF